MSAVTTSHAVTYTITGDRRTQNGILRALIKHLDPFQS